MGLEKLAKMRECMSKVKVRTPAERAEIERFCAEVLRRRVKLLMQTGYTEKGVATLQAICEYNLCMPERIRKCGSSDRKKYFEAFWDSGIARIGDVNGAGAILEFCFLTVVFMVLLRRRWFY
ncbi:unnamed protein product [Anisakis simplex]|uniref:40S ribosomal protein S15 n=1 Tax=Anisakis simplex TaxID=6269 RepID=A0A0M3JBW1_ANISI|nr:unnamed protein product [Anisakis simplex]